MTVATPRRLRGRTATATAYWTTTAVLASECVVGGAMDLLRLPPFFPQLTELGYPAYLATILGGAKLAAGGVILAPRLPRLKEWAYAGIVINMAGAAASWVLHRGDLANAIAPTAFVGLALASWALRPADRRL